MSVHEPISTDDTTVRPTDRARRRLDVSWLTIILFAVVISFVNGFWVTSLQGTVGAIERSHPPFERWLRDSTMMVPLYAAGILVAALLARRWFGRSPRAAVRGAGAALLIIAMCTLVGIAEVANSAAYDYRLQTRAHRARARHEPHRHTRCWHPGKDLDRRLCRDVRGKGINAWAPHPRRHQGQRADAGHQYLAGRMALRCRR